MSPRFLVILCMYWGDNIQFMLYQHVACSVCPEVPKLDIKNIADSTPVLFIVMGR